MASLVAAIFGSGLTNQDANARRGTQVGQALVSILFYGFGLLVAHKYSETGLRVVCIIFFHTIYIRNFDTS